MFVSWVKLGELEKQSKNIILHPSNKKQSADGLLLLFVLFLFCSEVESAEKGEESPGHKHLILL